MPIDITGHRYGKLLVIAESQRRTSGNRRWKCLCDCGREAVIDQGNLRSGLSTTCGCRGVPDRFCKQCGTTIRRGEEKSRQFCSYACRAAFDDPRPTKETIGNWIGIDPNTGCWNWKHVKTKKRPQIHWQGKRIYAYRAVFELMKDEKIPDNRMACHTCDNPRCVNPDHIFVGDAKGNQRDSVMKGRNQRGERHCFAKLTEEFVRSIRSMRMSGMTISAIAKTLPVSISRASIEDACARRTWKHVA